MPIDFLLLAISFASAGFICLGLWLFLFDVI